MPLSMRFLSRRARASEWWPTRIQESADRADAVHDGTHAFLGRGRVDQAVVAIAVEAVGAFFGPFDKAHVLVIDRAGELDQ
jgi:hypothetical protein